MSKLTYDEVMDEAKLPLLEVVVTQPNGLYYNEDTLRPEHLKAYLPTGAEELPFFGRAILNRGYTKKFLDGRGYTYEVYPYYWTDIFTEFVSDELKYSLDYDDEQIEAALKEINEWWKVHHDVIYGKVMG